MKKITKIFAVFALALCLSAWNAPLVFADDPPVNQSDTPTNDTPEPNDLGPGQKVGGDGQNADGGDAADQTQNGGGQGSFDVNKYLKLGKQTSLVPGGKSTSQTPTGIKGFAVYVIDLFVKVIGSLALIIFIAGALLTITSEGKEDRLEKGKTAMLYAVIGMVIALMSFIIVTFVQSIFY